MPKIVALIELISDDSFTKFDLPEVLLQPAFEVVDVGFRISIDKAARLADFPEKELRRLNAGLTHAVTPPTGPHTLYVPIDAKKKFIESLGKSGKIKHVLTPAHSSSCQRRNYR